MIKPEFFDDTEVATLTLAARLCFIGLWLYADREGRLVDNLKRLKAHIFPYDDDINIDSVVAELHHADMIRRYKTGFDGEKHGFIWIRNFVKHQRPHPKEPPSVIPPCLNGDGKKHGSPFFAGPDPSESGVLILDSGTRNLDSGSSQPANQQGETPLQRVKARLKTKFPNQGKQRVRFR